MVNVYFTKAPHMFTFEYVKDANYIKGFISLDETVTPNQWRVSCYDWEEAFNSLEKAKEFIVKKANEYV